MVVLRSKALSKISPYVLVVPFLLSNFELDWTMEAKRGKRGKITAVPFL